mgnify:CR=1 FL=1
MACGFGPLGERGSKPCGIAFGPAALDDQYVFFTNINLCQNNAEIV